MKQKGFKVMAAILAASTVVGTATPAFASDEIPAAVAEAVMEDTVAHADDSDYEIAYDLGMDDCGTGNEADDTLTEAAEMETPTEPEGTVEENAETQPDTEATVEENAETQPDTEATVEENAETQPDTEATVEENAEIQSEPEETADTETASPQSKTEAPAENEDVEAQAVTENQNLRFGPFAPKSFLVSFEGSGPNADPAVREGSAQSDDQGSIPSLDQFEDLSVDRDKALAEWKKEEEYYRLKEEGIQKKKEEAEKQKQRDAFVKATADEVGKRMGAFAGNVIDGKYSDTDEALMALSQTTLVCINNCLLKNIPYIGSFVHTIVGAQIGDVKEDQTIKRLDQISEKLDVINNTIRKCTQDVIDNDNFLEQDKKVGKMNAASEELVKQYRATNQSFQKAMLLLDHEGDNSQATERAFAAFDKIYNSENKSLLNTYVNYVKEITNSGQQLKPSQELSPDLMAAYRNIVTHDKTGDFAIVEFANERNALIDSVQEVGDYGYNMLNTILTAQQEKYQITLAACNNAIDELEKQSETATDEQKQRIREAISRLYEEAAEAQANLRDLNKDLTNLQNVNDTLNYYLQCEKASMNVDQQACDRKERRENLEYADHKFESETIGGVKTYVSVSADQKKIEYRDYYGNLVATRSVDEKGTEVNQYRINAGSVYQFNRYGTEKANWRLSDAKVLVEKVVEEPGPLHLGTIRTVYGWKLDDNGNPVERGSWTVGFRGSFKAYERKVGDLKVC